MLTQEGKVAQPPRTPQALARPGAPHTLQALQTPPALQTSQALHTSQAREVLNDLRVLLELCPAPPAEATQPMLEAAIQSASVVGALADRKSDTLLLRVSDEGYDVPLVLKVYGQGHPGHGQSAGRAGREADALLRLAQAGVCVPGLVASGERALLRRYVEGPVVRDLHWDAELANQLAEWVFSCHAALFADTADTIDAASVSPPIETTGLKAPYLGRSWLIGDMNLGNFVLDIASGRLFGIDLGDTRMGDPLDDVGEGCMRIIGRRPGFTADRWECAVAFASRYGRLAGNLEYVLSQVSERAAASFRQMAAWRADPFMAELADAFSVLWGEALGQVQD